MNRILSLWIPLVTCLLIPRRQNPWFTWNHGTQICLLPDFVIDFLSPDASFSLIWIFVLVVVFVVFFSLPLIDRGYPTPTTGYPTPTTTLPNERQLQKNQRIVIVLSSALITAKNCTIPLQIFLNSYCTYHIQSRYLFLVIFLLYCNGFYPW